MDCGARMILCTYVVLAFATGATADTVVVGVRLLEWRKDEWRSYNAAVLVRPHRVDVSLRYDARPPKWREDVGRRAFAFVYTEATDGPIVVSIEWGGPMTWFHNQDWVPLAGFHERRDGAVVCAVGFSTALVTHAVLW